MEITFGEAVVDHFGVQLCVHFINAILELLFGDVLGIYIGKCSIWNWLGGCCCQTYCTYEFTYKNGLCVIHLEMLLLMSFWKYHWETCFGNAAVPLLKFWMCCCDNHYGIVDVRINLEMPLYNSLLREMPLETVTHFREAVEVTEFGVP